MSAVDLDALILRHSHRGMAELRTHLLGSPCADAATTILSWRRETVALTTGFFVRTAAETDGPLGTVVLARALALLGFSPIVITDEWCRDFFEPEGLPVRYLPLKANEADCRSLLSELHPVGMIAIERCGHTASGDYCNMRGQSIAAVTAPIDRLFELAAGHIPTIGVGDGGNEIGMGKLCQEIKNSLLIEPCVVATDHLVLATVSNWGAYGITAALQQAAGRPLLPAFSFVRDYLARTVAMGSVDGMKGIPVMEVDGFGMDTEQALLEDLAKAVSDFAHAS